MYINGYIVGKDRDYVYALDRKNHFRRLPSKHMYQLPDLVVTERASRRLAKERKLWRTLHGAATGASLLALVFTYGGTNRWSFDTNKSIQETFVNARHLEDIGLTEVT